MWPLSTIKYVTRPTLRGIAPRVMLLGTYLAFEQDGVALFGQTVPAIALATAVFMISLVTRNFLFRVKKPEQRAEWVGFAIALVTVLGVLWLTINAELAYSVQKGWTAYLLFFAVLNLTFVKFDPEALHRFIPDGKPDKAGRLPKIFEWLAYGYVLRALTGEALAHWATEADWVLFMTLGSIALEFMVNWVIVMVLISSKFDEN